VALGAEGELSGIYLDAWGRSRRRSTRFTLILVKTLFLFYIVFSTEWWSALRGLRGRRRRSTGDLTSALRGWVAGYLPSCRARPMTL